MQTHVSPARTIPILLAMLAGVLATGPVQAQGTEKSRCFNFDGLPLELRRKSDEHLLKALDTEHLYTLVSGLKPMSGGFYNRQVATAIPGMDEQQAREVLDALGEQPEAGMTAEERSRLASARNAIKRSEALQEIDDLRRIVSTWTCGGEIHAEVVHYANPYAGNRHVQGVVFSLPSLKRKIKQKHRFFSRWAITPHSSPLEVVMAIDHARDASRFAGFGYLFGYPDDAVSFFVNADMRQDMTGDFVTRDFRAIPTFERADGQFTYAVPRGAAETGVDRELKQRAEIILEAYKARREQYIGEGKPGVAAMLRDWFCTSDDHCSPENAAL